MEKTKKLTKAQMFAQIKANYPLTADEVKFIDHELELLSKKNSAEKKPTAQQTANEAVKQAILKGMEPNRLYTIGEIIKEIPECADFTTSKASALCRQLVADGTLTVADVKVKGKGAVKQYSVA